MMSHAVKILNVTANAPFAGAYDFAHRPENFPKWASGLSSSLEKKGETWEAETPAGKAIVRFSDYNEYGVLDHWVKIEGKTEISIPLRMIVNGDGTEIELVLFREAEMDDAAFQKDIGTVESDLNTLKALLEDMAK